VIVCGQEFTSSQVRARKVEAQQDAAKLAFEYLQQQEQLQKDDTSTAGKIVISCS